MGGTSGVPTADPAAASLAGASPMSMAPPTGASDTGITPGTPGNPGIDFKNLPAWAEGLNKDSVQSIFNSLDSSAKPSAATPNTTPTENLGFPAAEPPGFQHVPYPTAPATGQVLGAAAPPPAAAAAAAPAAAAPAQSPDDWLYPGNLPMNFHGTGAEFGKPIPYSPTGVNYTAGYGAVGNFGGVAGYGGPQEGLADQKLLPQMEAGKQLTGADIDKYNRVRRADYDRYMSLYGVGYDLPAYQQALNGLVYQQNMQNYTPGGGG